MPKMIFVNLPVADVEKSAAFYEAIGFTKDARFSRPGSTAAMAWSDAIVFMILSRAHFADFTSKTIIDARNAVEALLCLSLDSRAGVDGIVEKARAAAERPTADRKTTASCTAAASRTSTAMCSSRCGWISRRRWPRWAHSPPKRPECRSRNLTMSQVATSTTPAPSAASPAVWGGRSLSGIVVLFLVMDAGMKIAALPIVPKARR